MPLFDTERAERAIRSALAGSPLAGELGATLRTIDDESGVVEMGFAPGPAFTQTFGVVQGGAVATMLDFAMGMAAHARVPESRRFATVSLNVSFIRPVTAGACSARGEIERLGRRLIFARASLCGPDGTTGATATSVLALADEA